MKREACVVFFIVTAAGLAFTSPRNAYQGTGAIDGIVLPSKAGEWYGQDIPNDLKIGKGLFGYISGLKTMAYRANGLTVYFTIIEGGNFHNPKLCFQGAGYQSKDLGTVTYLIGGQTLRTQSVIFKRSGQDILVFYWMCVNKKTVTWTEQKFKEFWASLIGQTKVGFIVRLDIPLNEDEVPLALPFVKDLVAKVYEGVSGEDRALIFGNDSQLIN